MRSRSTRSPRSRRRNDDFEETGGVSAFLIHHRRLIGGLTAFTVAFTYVAANAIWYQPHAHDGAFFATRPHGQAEDAAAQRQPGEADAARTETIIRLEREPEQETARETSLPPDTRTTAAIPPTPVPAPPPAQVPAVTPAPTPPRGDPVVENVQRVLAALNLYEGEIDGLNGPQTRAAVEAYRRTVGLEISTEIDDRLLAQLGAAPREAARTAAPAAPQGDPMVMRLQAGLKAFGNEGIEIDGMVGPRTSAALREFQSLFGLPETGEPDTEVYAKMREIGLTD